jgi:hypothetical protein
MRWTASLPLRVRNTAYPDGRRPALKTFPEIERRLSAGRSVGWRRALENPQAAGVAATIVLGLLGAYVHYKVPQAGP